MSKNNGRDPVTAIAESAARGRTAEIFADIREVMHIPLITSIWRILDGVEGGLESVWRAARPIYESGQPDAALLDLKANVAIPIPSSPSTQALERNGVPAAELPAMSSIIDAYTRSNGLNLMALNGIIAAPAQGSDEYPPVSLPPAWPTLRRLLERDEIDPSTWSLLEAIRHLGSAHENPSIATLWRHLAHWPGLLSQLIETYTPLQRAGDLSTASAQVADFARAKGPHMACFRGETGDIPDEALELVSRYVDDPSAVSRMVMMVHSATQWAARAH